MDNNRLINLIERERQIGADNEVELGGITYFETAGLQKWKGKYRLSISIFDLSKSDIDDSEVNEVLEFTTLNEAVSYMEKNCSIRFEKMNVCKGSKVFNPENLYSERKK